MCVGEKLKNVKQSCVVKTWKKIFSNFDFFFRKYEETLRVAIDNVKRQCEANELHKFD